MALQLLRAGWRKGAVQSDAFLVPLPPGFGELEGQPCDFAEGQDQMLLDDLADGVQYGPMVKVYLSPSAMALDELDAQEGCHCWMPESQRSNEQGTPSETTPILSQCENESKLKLSGAGQQKKRMRNISS